MGVPLEIRKVPRPTNTIVVDNKRDGPNRWAVRERAGVKYVSHGNPQPLNGRTIGYIYEGKFSPILENKEVSLEPEFLSYAASAFAKSVSEDLKTDLLDTFSNKDAITILVISILRVIKPGITLSRLACEYNKCFLCKFYPGIFLSKNKITEFIKNIGYSESLREKFFEARINRVSKYHHIIIDGTLKQDTSKVNDLSHFSYKAKLKDCKDISILYAYNLELNEPICSRVFPGNSIAASSYSEFIVKNNITKGIIISDKGFPPSIIKPFIKLNKDLHFITPLKRNDKRIIYYNMTSYSGVLEGFDKAIYYKKYKITKSNYLYMFMDARMAASESIAFSEKILKNKNYDETKYKKASKLFGTILFESDLDLDPRVVYKCYNQRWLIELLFRSYKNTELLTTTNVQNDYSIIGIEFINFISTVITNRMINKAQEVSLLYDYSFGELLENLREVWRMVEGPIPPKTGDRAWVHVLPSAMNIVELLGLSEPSPESDASEEPRRPGRPRTCPAFIGPKRRPGRPKKVQ